MIEKKSEHRLKKETFIFLKKILQTTNRFVVSTYYEFTEHFMEMFSAFVFPTKEAKVKFTTFRTF